MRIHLSVRLAPSQVRESSGSTDRRFAEALLRRRLDEIGAERLGVRPFVGRTEDRLTVAEMLDYLRDFTRFAFITGWRKGEVASLTWADVDREGGAVRLRPEASKNGHGRLVPIEDELIPLIERRWSARAIGTPEGARLVPHVFHRAGRPIGFIRKAWRRACEAAGVPGRLFHDLRRTAVRNMVRANVKEGQAMEISGHRTRAVFERYNISSEEDLRDAIRRTCRRRRGAERPAAVANLGRGNLGQPSAFGARRVPRSHTPDDDENIG